MEANGIRGRYMGLWEDDPEEGPVSLIWQPRAARELRVWNLWRSGPADVVHAFWGDSGMRVEVLGEDRFLFRCSDGPEPPDFSNVVFEVSMGEVEPPRVRPKRRTRASGGGPGPVAGSPGSAGS
jgi:hypothetical protein